MYCISFLKMKHCFSASPTAILNLSCKSLQKGAFLSKSKLQEHFPSFVFFSEIELNPCHASVCFSTGPSGSMDVHCHMSSRTRRVHIGAAGFLREVFLGLPFLGHHCQETLKQEGGGGSGGESC